jgi:hypothetical protein
VFAAAFKCFPRFNTALRIPVTPLPEANADVAWCPEFKVHIKKQTCHPERSVLQRSRKPALSEVEGDLHLRHSLA